MRLQHSFSTTFQHELLATLSADESVASSSGHDVAMLADRALAHDGRPQRYGSSLLMRDGRLPRDSIQDFAGLDSRRATIGLPPTTECVQLPRDIYSVPVVWPPPVSLRIGFTSRVYEISRAFWLARHERWTKVQLRFVGKFCIQGIRLGPLTSSLNPLAHSRQTSRPDCA